MNGAEVLDEYLDELLQTVAGVPAATPLQIVRDIVEAPVTSAAQVAGEAITETSAAPAFAAEPPAPVALAKEPVAADVIAEMLSDPAFGSVDVEGEVEVDAATAADRIAAELIAEMEADPAFPIPTADAEALDPIALLLAEMDADPAFASVAPIAASSVAADLIAEMEADPAFAAAIEESAPVEIEEDPHEREAVAEMQMMQAERLSRRVAAPAPGTPARPMPIRRPANALPRHIQALFRPVDTDQVQSHLRPTERSSRWLRLRCGEQAYALELLKVREVVLPTPLLRLRGTARSMLGIMNLRGLVVPVLDLGLYLGVDSVDIDPNTRVVVLEENGETMGLRVSAVEDVTTLTDQQIEPPDNTRLCRFSNQFFRGVARLGQRPMILLDASQLLH